MYPAAGSTGVAPIFIELAYGILGSAQFTTCPWPLFLATGRMRERPLEDCGKGRSCVKHEYHSSQPALGIKGVQHTDTGKHHMTVQNQVSTQRMHTVSKLRAHILCTGSRRGRSPERTLLVVLLAAEIGTMDACVCCRKYSFPLPALFRSSSPQTWV